jgi:hypothetical protein
MLHTTYGRWGGMWGLGATSLVSGMATAMAQFEGYNTPGTVAQRNNNPGNLRSGPGQIGTDSAGYAIFPDAATGWAALDNQIQLNINRGLTMNQFFAGVPGGYPGYAPSADSNNPAAYASFVASATGVPVDVPLNQLQSGASPSTAGTAPSDGSSGSTGSTFDLPSAVFSLTDTTPQTPSPGTVDPSLVVVGVLAAAVLLYTLS